MTYEWVIDWACVCLGVSVLDLFVRYAIHSNWNLLCFQAMSAGSALNTMSSILVSAK